MIALLVRVFRGRRHWHVASLLAAVAVCLLGGATLFDVTQHVG